MTMAVIHLARLQHLLSRLQVLHEAARTLTTSYRCCANNHYDVLGITPKATQGDIKTAYYKLSKIYHPDKSPDESSAKKFREVSEAYEVLGNVQLKKLYDRGLLGGGSESRSRVSYQPEPEPTDPTLRFYKSRSFRNIAPTMDGRHPIYDFDTWSKEHYGDLLKKQQYDKELLRKKRIKQYDTSKANRQEAIIYIMFLIGGLFAILVVNGTEDYDRDSIQRKRAQEIVEKGTSDGK